MYIVRCARCNIIYTIDTLWQDGMYCGTFTWLFSKGKPFLLILGTIILQQVRATVFDDWVLLE